MLSVFVYKLIYVKVANIKALTFDTGGTILDWHSGFSKGFEELKLNIN